MKSISRQALYDRVWDTPMSRLAKEFGLSDRGLAKLCARHDIPVPPRGYWAKKQAGHKVRQTPLPGKAAPHAESIYLSSSAPKPSELEELLTDQKKSRETQVQHQELQIPIETPHKCLDAATRKIRKLKADFVSAGQLRGSRVHSIEVSEAQSERLIAILDRIVRLAELRGIHFEFTQEGAKARYEGSAISIEAGELYRTVPHELTEKERREMDRWQASREKSSSNKNVWDNLYARPRFPEHDQIYSGRLFFRISNHEPSLRKSWQEGTAQRLDNLCLSIVDTLEAHFLAQRLAAQKAEQERREREILQHRRQLSEQRKKRESDRSVFLRKALDQTAEVDRLRSFLSQQDTENAEPELRRFLEWTQALLEKIETDLSPSGMAANLRISALFPESDPLHDPLGEPPPKTSWWM